MTVILMLAMFAIFLTIDYVGREKKQKKQPPPAMKPLRLRRAYSPRLWRDLNCPRIVAITPGTLGHYRRAPPWFA